MEIPNEHFPPLVQNTDMDVLRIKFITKQECITVGCVLTTTVAKPRCHYGGYPILLRGGPSGGRHPGRNMGHTADPQKEHGTGQEVTSCICPVNRMTVTRF